jgi:hypothetical protein
MNTTFKLTILAVALSTTFAAQATTSSNSPPMLVSDVYAFEGAPDLSPIHSSTVNRTITLLAEQLVPFSTIGHSGTLRSVVYNVSGSNFYTDPWCCNQVGRWIPFDSDVIFYQITNNESSTEAINKISQKVTVTNSSDTAPNPSSGMWVSQYKGAFADFVTGTTKASSTETQVSTFSWDGEYLVNPTTTTFGAGIMPGTSSFIGKVEALGWAHGWVTVDGQKMGALLPIPEPESYAMLLAGLGLIGSVIRKRNAKLA